MACCEDKPENWEPAGWYGDSLLKLLIGIGILASDSWGEPLTSGANVWLRLGAGELRRLRLCDSCETVRSSRKSSRGSELGRESGLGEMRFPPEYPSSPSCDKIGLGQRARVMDCDDGELTAWKVVEAVAAAVSHASWNFRRSRCA